MGFVLRVDSYPPAALLPPATQAAAHNASPPPVQIAQTHQLGKRSAPVVMPQQAVPPTVDTLPLSYNAKGTSAAGPLPGKLINVYA